MPSYKMNTSTTKPKKKKPAMPMRGQRTATNKKNKKK